MQTLKYLAGYPEHVRERVRTLLAEDRIAPMLRERYGASHAIRTDRQLYEYVVAMKERHLRQAVPLHKVVYDRRLQVMQHALGLHTSVSRVQGHRLKASREIRIDAVFIDAPADFLRMIVVHELAHLREPDHTRAFYQLCSHIEPDYHRLEFDLRLYLTLRDLPRDA
ncbi:M48 family metallopeptidase [Chiayiivirga flava]|uniref:YgjP-like metallopeptidase domain-containing protein n=1 Tax=Chiayiivirga flava TaxID=659595 RepID=A0A7W8DAW8_9GAMM|nr:YgjP-like metallopeptidase domain-containing protein [Chiayiivirga flava]MBB5209776.1 hypothetical protein [Chiayiivirga flava]